MKSSRPAHILTHRARRAERNDTMEEDKKAIVKLLDLVEHRMIMRMIRDIVHWLTAHQNEII